MQVIHATASLHVLQLRHNVSSIAAITSVDVARSHGTLIPYAFAWNILAVFFIIFFAVLLHLLHLNGIILDWDLFLTMIYIFLFAERIVIDRSKTWVLMTRLTAIWSIICCALSFRRTRFDLLLLPLWPSLIRSLWLHAQLTSYWWRDLLLSAFRASTLNFLITHT